MQNEPENQETDHKQDTFHIRAFLLVMIRGAMSGRYRFRHYHILFQGSYYFSDPAVGDQIADFGPFSTSLQYPVILQNLQML